MDHVEQLLAAARAAHSRAYAPYSNFPVGAALLTARGQIFSGCNVENAALPNGICAETSAIAAMVNAGEQQIAAILTVGNGDTPVPPCGGCRQRLREFAAPGAKIYLATRQGVQQTFTLDGLLPQSFGPDHLARGARGSSR